MNALRPALEAPLTARRRRFDPAAQALVAGEYAECGARAWPRRAVCHRCGNARIEETLLPRQGTLTTWSRVWVPVEGIEPPYDVGLIDLGGIVVFAHLRGTDDAITVPMPVRLRVDLDATPPFWAEPVPPDS